MGIVRDVTVDQLKQAVDNIDTSTLAQDSTLQDVVTAISNISGGSDPVTNTTVNTLGKDTTLQSIAAAITGLGTALGSDKANINGSNIVDQNTFRSNIGFKNKSVTGTTDNNGNIFLNLANTSIVYCVLVGNSIAVPFVYNNIWYASIRQTNNFAAKANTSVTVTVYYY